MGTHPASQHLTERDSPVRNRITIDFTENATVEVAAATGNDYRVQITDTVTSTALVYWLSKDALIELVRQAGAAYHPSTRTVVLRTVEGGGAA